MTTMALHRTSPPPGAISRCLWTAFWLLAAAGAASGQNPNLILP